MYRRFAGADSRRGARDGSIRTPLRRLLNAPGVFAFVDFKYAPSVSPRNDAGTDYVSSIQDRVGGFTLSQATTTAQPSYSGGVATFDGTDDILSCTDAAFAAFDSGAALSVLWVGQYAVSSAWQTVVSIGTATVNDKYLEFSRNSGVDVQNRRNVSGTSATGSAVSTAASRCYVHTYDGDNGASWINGAASISSTALSAKPTGLGNFSLGGILRLAGTLQPASIALRGAILAKGAWSVSQVASLTADANAYWL